VLAVGFAVLKLVNPPARAPEALGRWEDWDWEPAGPPLDDRK